METTFTPALCDGVRYSGSISIRPLSFDERLDMYEDMRGGKDDEAAKEKMGIAVLKKVGKMSHKFVTKCEVTRLEDGHKYTWDEVYHDGDLTGLVVEVCNKILGKIAAGI